MNLAQGFFVFRMWRELLVVLGILAFLIFLPILVVISLLSGGTASASGAVAQPSSSGAVQLYSPDGDGRGQFTAVRSWPTHGMVTLEFGESDVPFQVHHTGIDIAAKIGTEVRSFAAGTVTAFGSSKSQGNYIYIDHGQGVTTRYYHLSRQFVAVNQAVTASTLIGEVGSTGFSTGPHLHFEIRVADIPVNPRTFLEGNP